MHRFGQMGDGAMDKIWDGDGMGSGNHKPSSTEPGRTLFPPGTTKAQVEGWFKSIAANPDSRPQARPHGDGWVVSGTRDGINCVVTLDKDGSISGGFPVSGEASPPTRRPGHRTHGRPMEVIDFYRLSRRITDQLAPKISPNYRPIVLTAGGAGAWALAIPTLVGALSEEDVVITTAEKDALRELMEFRREPLTYLEQIRTSD